MSKDDTRECADCLELFEPRRPSGYGFSYCLRCQRMRAHWHSKSKSGGKYVSPFRKSRDCDWCFQPMHRRRSGQRFHGACRNQAEAHWVQWRRLDACHLPTCFDCMRPMPWTHACATSPHRCDACKRGHRGPSEVKRRHAVRSGDQSISWQTCGERDGWVCHLCRCKVKREAGGAKNPKGATVDHLIPVSADGHHEWDNVALACWDCNVRRGALGLVQLRLA